MTIERPEAFNFFGPQTLVGPELQPGDTAPDFQVVNGKFQPVSLQTFAGKPLLISVVPSLDTGVCSKQTVRFNEEAEKLKDQAGFLTVSMDLPFAQGRFCATNNTEAVIVASDHQQASFGAAYGTLIKGMRIDSRAVFVVGNDGKLTHVEYVPTAGQEPNYDAALAALKQAIGA